MKNEITVKDLINILKNFPKNAIIVSDDGTGWVAKVREQDVTYDKEFHQVSIFANGEGF